MRVLIAIILVLTTIMAAEVPEMKPWEMESAALSTPGLRKDYYNLYGLCKNSPLSFFKDEVDAAKSCNDKKDYKCFKACQFERMGISDSSGNINKTKFIEHTKKKFEKFKDVTVVTTYVYNITNCLSDNGKKVVLYTAIDQCAKNERFLNCTIVAHHKNCVLAWQEGSKPPPVPTTLQ